MAAICLIACRPPPPVLGLTDSSADDTDTDIDADTLPIGSDTGVVPVETDYPVSVFDTAGPACAGEPGDTGLLVDIPVPEVACPYNPIPRGVPGVSVVAGDIAMARLFGDVNRVLGIDMHALGDLDADGYGEIAVGGPGYTGWYQEDTIFGEVWIFHGPLAGDLNREDARSILTTLDVEDRSGQYLAVGSLRGPGTTDLVIDGLGYMDVYVVPLPTAPGAVGIEAAATASIVVPGGITLDHPSIGDADGDGQSDLSLSGRSDKVAKTGGVSIFRGPIAGVIADADAATWGTWQAMSLDDDDEVLIGQISGRETRALIRDLDGDGDSEILMGGDRLADIAPGSADGEAHGGFVLFPGGTGGAHDAGDATAVLYGECGARFGYYLERVGDVTGDCRPDVAAGAAKFAFPGEAARGAVLVLSELHRAKGDVPISAVAGAVIVGEEVGDQMASAGYIGDLDRDGFDDLLVGSWTGGAGSNGAAYLFLGPVHGVLSAGDADLAIYGSGSDEVFGAKLRSARDLNGDGIADLLVSAYSTDLHGFDSNSGVVYVFSGADLLGLLPTH